MRTSSSQTANKAVVRLVRSRERGPDKKPRKPRIDTPSVRINLRLPPEEAAWLRKVSSHKVSDFVLAMIRSEMGKEPEH